MSVNNDHDILEEEWLTTDTVEFGIGTEEVVREDGGQDGAPGGGVPPLPPPPPVPLVPPPPMNNARRRAGHLFNLNREEFVVEEHEAADIEEGGPNPQEDIDLSFSPNYDVIRHPRKLNRSEVLAFVCVNVTVICIILLAHLGMHALGYHRDSKVPPTHIPRTFSWKLLQEFFLADSLTSLQRECMFFNRKRLLLGEKGGKDNLLLNSMQLQERDEEILANRIEDEMEEQAAEISQIRNKSQLAPVGPDGILNHTDKCSGLGGETNSYDEWNFMRLYLRTMLLPIINVVCALIFLLSISCRRKRILQCLLIMPSFISFFLAIFQQIPLTFSYSYSNMILLEGMHNSLGMAVSPYIVPPVWEETQMHGKCCGINNAETWSIGIDAYPPSCCDTTTNKCKLGMFPTRNEIWKKGCFRDEEAKLKYYEMYALLLLTVKLLAEIGVFWSLSDLTRYDYPPQAQLLNATCIAYNYEVRTKGIVTIMGVTKSNKMILKLKRFGNRTGLLKYRIERAGPLVQVFVIYKHTEQVLGSFECQRQMRRENPNGPVFDFNKGRKLGVIILSL